MKLFVDRCNSAVHAAHCFVHGCDRFCEGQYLVGGCDRFVIRGDRISAIPDEKQD
ncbi:MAG: hypothetical protein ACFB4J_10960 [Elainellaceae cyanobacterium]